MYIFETQLKLDGVEKEVLVVFSGQLEGNKIDYSELIEKGFKRFQNKPEEVLFLFPNYIRDKVLDLFTLKGKCFQNLIRYGKDIPITFLLFNGIGEFESLNMNGASQVCTDLIELRKQIVDRGIFSLAKARKDQVILKAPSGTVFIKPSEKESDEFIKASELTVGYAENQFIAFSLLSRAPKGRDIKRIFIDTSSISSFVEALLFYWTKFNNSECKTAVYHSYGSYDGMDDAKPEMTDDIWLIISASASNSMGIKMAHDWGLTNDQVITILSYTDTLEDNNGDEILINIAPLSSSALNTTVQGSLMKVKVWGENFTAEVEKPNPVLIRAEHKTLAINGLIIPNNANGLIKCNKIVSPDYSVSSIYIDCNEYLKTDYKYLAWIEKIVDWYIPPKVGWLVYKGIDEASKTLVNSIEARLKVNGINGFKKIDITDAKTEIKGNDCVVVAMPVTGSGQTLLKLNRNLRISGHDGNRIFISPFVLASSKSSYEQFRNSLVYGPNQMKYLFFSWKNAYIGHSDKINSWEAELAVVQHFDTPFWMHRAEKLSNIYDGIEGAIGTPSIKESNILEFTPDFAFWAGKAYDPDTINHEAVYLTVSSILQGLREKPFSETDKDSLFSYVYQHSVISPDNFTRFTDALLQSCLWRAANIREMDYRSDVGLSADFSNILERLIEENSSGNHNAALDLLMGIATGKIQLANEVLENLMEKALTFYANTNENAMLLVNFIQNKYLPNYPSSNDDLIVV
jgi:hypothetical protein